MKRCHIVDERGNIIIHGANVVRELFTDFNCKMSTHVHIRYYDNFDNMMCDIDEKNAIFPKNQVFYFETER